MRLILRLFCVLSMLAISSFAEGGLLTGQTPATANPPVGWTIKATQDFESGCPDSEDCGLWGGGITTSRPYNGSYSLEGTYAGDQAAPGWRLYENQIGSLTQLYISWYEWLDPEARFNDEFWMLHVVVPTIGSESEPWEEIVLPWFEGYDESGNMVYNGTRSNLTLVMQGNAASGFEAGDRVHLKQDNPATGTWVQWEVHLIPAIGANAGSVYIYRDGDLYASQTNYTISQGADFSNAQITIGSQYSAGVWVDIPTEDCGLITLPDSCSNPGVGLNMGICWPEGGGSFSNPTCYPVQPAHATFKRYFDDIIVMTSGGTPGGDTSPPYTNNNSPGKNSTGWPVGSHTIQFYVRDPSGVTRSSIGLSIDGGTVMRCDSGLVCSP